MSTIKARTTRWLGEYRDRVRRGAELLDSLSPGWAQRIVLDRLAMESCDRCILGQLYGDFTDGWFRLTREMDCRRIFTTSRYGFSLPQDEQYAALNAGGEKERAALFAPLAAAWRDEILARTAPATAGEGVAHE